MERDALDSMMRVFADLHDNNDAKRPVAALFKSRPLRDMQTTTTTTTSIISTSTATTTTTTTTATTTTTTATTAKSSSQGKDDDWGDFQGFSFGVASSSNADDFDAFVSASRSGQKVVKPNYDICLDEELDKPSLFASIVITNNESECDESVKKEVDEKSAMNSHNNLIEEKGVQDLICGLGTFDNCRFEGQKSTELINGFENKKQDWLMGLSSGKSVTSEHAKDSLSDFKLTTTVCENSSNGDILSNVSAERKSDFVEDIIAKKTDSSSIFSIINSPNEAFMKDKDLISNFPNLSTTSFGDSMKDGNSSHIRKCEDLLNDFVVPQSASHGAENEVVDKTRVFEVDCSSGPSAVNTNQICLKESSHNDNADVSSFTNGDDDADDFGGFVTFDQTQKQDSMSKENWSSFQTKTETTQDMDTFSASAEAQVKVGLKGDASKLTPSLFIDFNSLQEAQANIHLEENVSKSFAPTLLDEECSEILNEDFKPKSVIEEVSSQISIDCLDFPVTANNNQGNRVSSLLNPSEDIVSSISEERSSTLPSFEVSHRLLGGIEAVLSSSLRIMKSVPASLCHLVFSHPTFIDHMCDLRLVFLVNERVKKADMEHLQRPELRRIMQHIRACFEEIEDCCRPYNSNQSQKDLKQDISDECLGSQICPLCGLVSFEKYHVECGNFWIHCVDAQLPFP